MIYLDNAATSLIKPVGVENAVVNAMRSMASPGRGAHAPAMRAAETVFECREAAARLFKVAGAANVVFTMNATHALNIAIRSVVKPGSRVLVSGFEHNSVTRPLRMLTDDITVAGSRLFDEENTLSEFDEKLRRADAVVCTHVSNAFGYILPVYEIAALCRRAGVPLIVDASQSAGVLDVDFARLGAAFVAMPGHKEASRIKRGFENSFLLPYPKKEAVVTISLKDVYHKVNASLTHEIIPNDILIHQRGTNHITPHRYLLQNGNAADCIDVAIMAEGYTEKEMDIFYKDAQTACDALFSHEPFKKLKDKFNIVAVASPSEDSGVSIPGQGKWKSTAVSSHFNTFYSDRYLTTSRVKSIHNWLAGIPYEHIIILANTDTYGGGGIYNSYTLTTAHHPDFQPVVVHEFGHSFGGLADEYAYTEAPSPQYPYEVEPWEPNITTLIDFDSKWKDMIPEGTAIPTPVATENADLYTKVGVYEGAGYTQKGLYRPTTECRMKINEAPAFCPVCQRALERLINFYTAK